MSTGNLYIVSAPSGGGKTSLTRALLPLLIEHGIPTAISVSYTTRAPRPGEEHGTHYHFIDETEFVSMIEPGHFLEHAQVFGNRYGTGLVKTRELLESGHDVILDIDWQGARQIKARMPHATGIFILPPTLAELEKRLRARKQDNDATIAERMAKSQAEMSHYAEYDYLIINRDFRRALEEMAAIFIAGRLTRSAQQETRWPMIQALLAPPTPIR